MGKLENEFNEYRAKMNEVILGKNNLVMKRLWNLDTNTYEDGALDKRTKEMLAPEEPKDIHPLGKSPVISIQGPTQSKPRVIAESGFIVEYVTEHFGKWMIPKQFPERKRGKIWRRDGRMVTIQISHALR